LTLLHLYIFTKSVALKYDVANLKLKLKGLKSINRMLAARLSAQEALPGIENKAESLGMSYPEKVNYIIITEEGN